MPTLSKSELLERVLSPIRALGWNVIFVSSSHPFDLAIFRGDNIFKLRLYIWNVTHGGGRMRAPGEYRIQITGVTPPLAAPMGCQTLLCGWYEPRGVIAAFDPTRHRNPSDASPSIQVALSTLQEAASSGLAVQQRGNEEIALAFKPQFLITYIQSQASLHAFAGAGVEIDLLEKAGAGETIRPEEIERVPIERRKIIRTVSSNHRETDFRRRVLEAYDYSCAMCHLQLELVEAAHILPVALARSTDETSNGLALCALHHDAYDDALVGVRPNYRIMVNASKVRQLRHIRRASEEARFRQDLRQRILLPQESADYPRPDYLREALRVRGWADT